MGGSEGPGLGSPATPRASRAGPCPALSLSAGLKSQHSLPHSVAAPHRLCAPGAAYSPGGVSGGHRPRPASRAGRSRDTPCGGAGWGSEALHARTAATCADRGCPRATEPSRAGGCARPDGGPAAGVREGQAAGGLPSSRVSAASGSRAGVGLIRPRSQGRGWSLEGLLGGNGLHSGCLAQAEGQWCLGQLSLAAGFLFLLLALWPWIRSGG